MSKIFRSQATAEAKRFWESVDRIAAKVDGWEDWRRAGINVSQTRVVTGTVKGTFNNKAKKKTVAA